MRRHLLWPPRPLDPRFQRLAAGARRRRPRLQGALRRPLTVAPWSSSLAGHGLHLQMRRPSSGRTRLSSYLAGPGLPLEPPELLMPAWALDHGTTERWSSYLGRRGLVRSPIRLQTHVRVRLFQSPEISSPAAAVAVSRLQLPQRRPPCLTTPRPRQQLRPRSCFEGYWRKPWLTRPPPLRRLLRKAKASLQLQQGLSRMAPGTCKSALLAMLREALLLQRLRGPWERLAQAVRLPRAPLQQSCRTCENSSTRSVIQRCPVIDVGCWESLWWQRLRWFRWAL
mmetsp:Transcript_46175/g.100321  ORF Transcript_46175/g.100321 Transcript_46175/m.100321 type:complete len:282 (-) Transcript_46175:126-971(-)